MEGICWFEKTGIGKNRVHSWEATRHNIYKKAINVTKMKKDKRVYYVGGENVERILRKVVRKDVNLKTGFLCLIFRES
jgi:hypothetical protein